jgi:hypothetical protein
VPFQSASSPNGVIGIEVKFRVRSNPGRTPVPGDPGVQIYTGAARATLGSLHEILRHVPVGGGFTPTPTPVGPAPNRQRLPLYDDQIRLWPVAIMQSNLLVNGTTSLYTLNETLAPGNWAAICYEPVCSNSQIQQWGQDGYDVSLGALSLAPTMNAPFAPYATYPVAWNGQGGGTGVWQDAATGNGAISALCPTLITAAAEQWKVFVPIVAPDAGGNATNNQAGSNLRYHIAAVALFEVAAASCPGTTNTISGRFLGYGWDAQYATGIPDLGPALSHAQTVLQPLPPGEPLPTDPPSFRPPVKETR